MRSSGLAYSGWTFLIYLFLIGCASSHPAPVIERLPAAKKPVAAKPVGKPTRVVGKPTTNEKDWRPDTYTVKKGDTLISIGLEFGYDYKDIAQKNDIQPPYLIRVDQVLDFKGGKTATTNINQAEDNGGVVVTPLKTEPTTLFSTSAPAPVSKPMGANTPPLLNEPKALRQPYSEKALAEPATPPKSAKTVEMVKSSDSAMSENVAKIEATKAEAATDDDEAIEWVWPVQGKILAGFNESESAKGIDIEGTQGQAIIVSAPGKVIYSGSDLRGYGKLVIVKHNKTYLSVYAHNSKILVKEGQQVNKGQKIAEMGNTDSDRVKLHFEIRRQGKSVDPAKYLSSSPN